MLCSLVCFACCGGRCWSCADIIRFSGTVVHMSVMDPRNENGVAQRCTRFENGPALGESGYSFENATPTMIMTSERRQRCSFGTLQLKLLPLDCLRSPELGRCRGTS